VYINSLSEFGLKLDCSDLVEDQTSILNHV